MALPAGEYGGGSVVAVWAGAGLEEDGGGAEGEVGVDAAGGSEVLVVVTLIAQTESG